MRSLNHESEILFSFLYESIQAFQLSQPERGLYVRGFHVQPDMRVDIFVIVARWNVLEFPIEPLAAGIVFARRTPAIPPPIPDTFDSPLQCRVVCDNHASLASRHVVSGIKGMSRQMTKRAGFLTVDLGTESVAVVLYNENPIYVHEPMSRPRVAESVGDHDGSAPIDTELVDSRLAQALADSLRS